MLLAQHKTASFLFLIGLIIEMTKILQLGRATLMSLKEELKNPFIELRALLYEYKISLHLQDFKGMEILRVLIFSE